MWGSSSDARRGGGSREGKRLKRLWGVVGRKDIFYSAPHRPPGRYTVVPKSSTQAWHRHIGSMAHRLQGNRHAELQADRNRKTGEDRDNGQG